MTKGKIEESYNTRKRGIDQNILMNSVIGEIVIKQ